MKIIKTSIYCITVIGLVFSLLSCAFDQNRQFDLRYPAVLILENKQSKTINVTSIYNSNDTLAGFILQGGKIAAKGNINMRISEATFHAIDNGKFIVEGSCKNESKWHANGGDIRRKSVQNNVEWKVILYIDKCE